MYYEINIAKDGQHFFATAERSCTTMSKTMEVYDALKSKFPAAEGYEITVTVWEHIGHQMNMEKEDK